MTEQNVALSLAKTDLSLVCSGLELQISSYKRAANNANKPELRELYSKYHDDAVSVLAKVRNLELAL